MSFIPASAAEAAQDPEAEQARAEAARSAPAHDRAEQPTAEAPLTQASEPPREIQDALRSLVRGYELESDVVRRHKVRVWREAEEFWKGNQNIFWSERDFQWHTPFESEGGREGERPAYDYSTNLFRAWGMSIIAALTQRPPKINYLPASAESEDDVATAQAATKIAALIARNNEMEQLRTLEAYYLWTQGLYAGYMRYVVDGGLFGYHDEAVIEQVEVELSPALAICTGCGAEVPAPAPPAACAQCGAALGADAWQPAQTAAAPVRKGTRKVPNGAEKLDIYGPLYVKLPPQARNQRECYYLVLVEEQHKATLRAAYPTKASQIEDVGSGAEDTYERIVRLSLADAQGTWNSLPMSSLVTYKRAWVRPEAFWAHADPLTRAKLLELYPDGCRVEFAGDVFLAAEPEKLDDCWALCLGLPGIGIYRDALGYDAIPIQRQINDAANILAEHREMASAPPILYDARYVNGEALAGKRMQPASYTPVVIESAGPQIPLADLIFQPTLHVDPQLWSDGERLAEVGQFIVGALPTIFGGGSPNLKTATAYAQAREQAMGRLSRVWSVMRETEARLMTLGIECFKRNRLEDVEIPEAAHGGFRSDHIRLADVRGNAVARPSADEDFPQSWSARRDTIMQLLASKDPELLEVIGAPVNRPILKHYIGLPELVDPGEENRAKQARETDALLASAPVAGQDGEPRPTIMPDALVDDHALHIQAIKDWAVSDAGVTAKAARPAGYANVLAHLVAHMDAAEAVAARQAQRAAQVRAAAAPQSPAPQGPAPEGESAGQ